MDPKAFLKMPEFPTRKILYSIIDYNGCSNGAGAVASSFLMSSGLLTQTILWLGVALLIICFIKGMLINFHLSFRNEKWINCIDFVMRTLQHIEVIIIIIVPAFISFNVSRNEPAKGK